MSEKIERSSSEDIKDATVNGDIEEQTEKVDLHPENDAEVSDASSNDIRIVTSSTSMEYEKSRGVRRIENVRTMMLTAKNGKSIMVIFCTCLLIIAWVYSLDASTTASYAVPATSSFNRHSMISSVNVASAIIGSVVQPFQAKFADITSRPLCFALSLAFYTVGVIIAAASSTIGAYVVGSVCTAVGSNGVSFVRDIIVADLTDLKWRGLVNALMTSPYIITVWFSGLIVDAILKRNWRWGYGMFAIIMPVIVLPVIYVLYHFERKAQKLVPQVQKLKKSFMQIVWDSALQIDAFGLVIMGFGWALLLLPFSLQPYAENGWKNPSLIAMFVVGPVLLIAFTAYEIFWAPYPLMPRRILYNKTFITAVLINFIYLLADGVRAQYLSSIVLVGKNWSYQNWTYFNNTLTVSLCFFGVVAGVTYRITRRYKWLNSLGIFLRMVSYCIPLTKQGTMANTGQFVMSQIIMGIGSAYNTIGTVISSQASVPHQDMSLVMALLLLWSTVGSAIGYTISGQIWTNKMYNYLREFMPLSVTDDEVYEYYTDLSSLQALEWDDPVRQGAVKALATICPYFFVAPIVLELINLFLSFMQTDYYLGDTHNAIEDQDGKDPTDPTKEKQEIPTTWKGKILYLLS
ncbi:hypothetical protein C7M61_004017 [Candidozyma pseudohaemuli]|uniref:Major facilitator superfamily (MFS) profile domain-containing protein n=1 Tax=Candidozyma pseudohaemuli TaxID=418784 RepID=A0A2P7YKR4_9ASCO|nr:hypothetical protein C7M61_004017 [[Candida] pseudohaemulonii]PSK36544.1 hypothetical protein C7M61_004017 [[Candida] pseudohaemulonii]